jgi:cytochrome c-type biogenesis protein CcmE
VKAQSRFVAGGVALVGVVVYLMVTGAKSSMTYYYTPTELVAKAASDPTLAEVGVKVGGRVVPGSVRYDQRTLQLDFTLADIETGRPMFPVRYLGPLPDTFKEGRDVVVDGRYVAGGTFTAATLLTKCGSRYEAAESDFKASRT